MVLQKGRLFSLFEQHQIEYDFINRPRFELNIYEMWNQESMQEKYLVEKPMSEMCAKYAAHLYFRQNLGFFDRIIINSSLLLKPKEKDGCKR